MGIENARDHGAVGDNMTDDTAALQRAIDAAAKKGEARRPRQVRKRTKPTAGQLPPREVGEVDEEAERAKMYQKMMLRFFPSRRRPRGKFVEPERGERALRKAIVLAERRAAQERAYANGKRRG